MGSCSDARVRRLEDWSGSMRRSLILLGLAILLVPGLAAAQGLTGALIGTVLDDQGGVLPGAVVRMQSPALIGGPATVLTNEKGQLRFPTLAPGTYVLDIELAGFAALHEDNIRIGGGATVERTVVLKVAGLTESVVVEGAGSRIEARNPGFGTRFGLDDLKAIPTRRANMFDWIRAAPGISPTSPSSGTITTISAFGSGTNENQFLIDGTNFTCPCSGVARAEPGTDFIQEVQVQSVGASAEFGNAQGAVINVLLKQGSNRLLYDAAYYGQTSGLTGEATQLRITGSELKSGYHRVRYRDLTSSVGGPVVRDRLWFFGGYEYLRDDDSQPGTIATLPRRAESDKVYGKLTWQLAPGWQLVNGFHDELQENSDQPTIVLPFLATQHHHATVPATTFGQLTHTSANTVWDVRVGGFLFSQVNKASTGDLTTPSRFDSFTQLTSGGPPSFSKPTIQRTTAKATVSQYRLGVLGADHELKAGTQIEKAGHHSVNIIPTGVRYMDNNGQPSQAISADPANVGGQFITISAFATDALRVGSRLTVNAGVRFDHNRAYSQDLPRVDLNGNETDVIVQGLGTLYTWNLWSPRLGVAAKLSADGRTILRASYGRFSQGVLTGELEPFHPGGPTTTIAGFDPATGGYTRIMSRTGPLDLLMNAQMRAPRTDEYSVGVDREVGRQLAVAMAYVRKDGANFIGWTDVGGQYVETPTLLKDGRTVSVFKLVNNLTDRKYLLTNPDGYSLTYNGLVTAVEKRRSHGWQASGSYTYSRAFGLQPSSGATASGEQRSTVSPPNALTFGRDPNDLINASGRLPNDRPHQFRVMGGVDVLRTGFVVAANLQHFTGKPWAATALINPQNAQQRVLLEPRGTRRLSSQTLLDLRVSRALHVSGLGSIDLLLDVLNVLNDTAEENLASDILFNAQFGQPTSFIDPRRAMLGVRMNFGR
jgi:TonB dependent receptor-like, beta-barrel/Carboxypeptidase regulatory-like domain